jgi:hypothetical protein
MTSGVGLSRPLEFKLSHHRFFGHAGSQQREIKVIAALDRQFLDALFIDGGTDGGLGRVDGGRLRRDGHLCCDACRRQEDIQVNSGAERNCYACMPVRREAGLGRRDLIDADRPFGDMVRAFGIGGNLAGLMSGGVPYSDRDAGDAPAAGIANRAGESAADERGLRPGAGSQPNAKKKCSVASPHSVSVVRQTKVI